MTEKDFYALMATIESEDLRERVSDSALTNAGDTEGVTAWTTPEFWEVAIVTAKMILDAPRDWYPELY